MDRYRVLPRAVHVRDHGACAAGNGQDGIPDDQPDDGRRGEHHPGPCLYFRLAGPAGHGGGRRGPRSSASSAAWP